MSGSASRSARERLREERARQAKSDKRRRILITSVVVVLALTAVVIGVLVQVNRAAPSAFTGGLAPVSVSPDGSVTMAQPGVDKPVLEVYEDFQCPMCKEFERVNGGAVKDLAARGKVKIVYHPIAFVNPTGSLRAAAAAQCVPGGKWMAFHDAIFTGQPDERTALTVQDLKDFADQAKIDDSSVISCMENQKYAGLITQNTAAAFKTPDVQGTPTLILDGRKLDDNDTFTSDGLRSALQSATTQS
ncbi:DsbA family protein [Nonomuraea sp. CA-141351]|uniref:DsbA family protein n=1 Tax=Nonomuraea sp. CA-141351 TaxID=3239996 RepID=UPI003D932969